MGRIDASADSLVDGESEPRIAPTFSTVSVADSAFVFETIVQAVLDSVRWNRSRSCVSKDQN